ncbi:TPA: hypothetical protein ACLBFA_000242 [Neisseria meningitidis]
MPSEGDASRKIGRAPQVLSKPLGAVCILIAYAVPVSGFLRGRGFAGLPATVMPSGMSHTITAPAPIQLPSFPNGVENVGRKAVYAP